jgi:hypothetical protein
MSAAVLIGLPAMPVEAPDTDASWMAHGLVAAGHEVELQGQPASEPDARVNSAPTHGDDVGCPPSVLGCMFVLSEPGMAVA